MTLIHTLLPNRNALHTSKQGARSVEIGALVPLFEKISDRSRNQTFSGANGFLHMDTPDGHTSARTDLHQLCANT